MKQIYKLLFEDINIYKKSLTNNMIIFDSGYLSMIPFTIKSVSAIITKDEDEVTLTEGIAYKSINKFNICLDIIHDPIELVTKILGNDYKYGSVQYYKKEFREWILYVLESEYFSDNFMIDKKGYGSLLIIPPKFLFDFNGGEFIFYNKKGHYVETIDGEDDKWTIISIKNDLQFKINKVTNGKRVFFHTNLIFEYDLDEMMKYSNLKILYK